MTPTHLPEDHDASDFSPYDDMGHGTQDGRWVGYAFIGIIVAVIVLVLWIGR